MPVRNEDPEGYSISPLRQALWDVFRTLGFDTDGELTPEGVVDLTGMVKRAAKEFREDYDALLEASIGSLDAETVKHFAATGDPGSLAKLIEQGMGGKVTISTETAPDGS